MAQLHTKKSKWNWIPGQGSIWRKDGFNMSLNEFLWVSYSKPLDVIWINGREWGYFLPLAALICHYVQIIISLYAPIFLFSYLLQYSPFVFTISPFLCEWFKELVGTCGFLCGPITIARDLGSIYERFLWDKGLKFLFTLVTANAL